MIQLASRLPSVGTTIFTVMSRLAADVGAINLSQGFPDFDCDPGAGRAVARHMRAGRNQYAPMPGVPGAARGDRRDVPDVVRTAPTIRKPRSRSPPAPPRRSSARSPPCVHPGDEVIVLEPCYDSYVPAIELNGGMPVVVSLRYPDYSVDWDAVRRAITPRTRLLMINTPHNPTGSMLTAERHPRAGGDRRRHRHPPPRRRGLPAHHLRRPPSREPCAACRARRAQLRRQLVRQDVSRHGLEGRLRRGAGGADDGAAQGAPVRDVLDQHAVQFAFADFLGAGRGLQRAGAVLPGEARSVPAPHGRIAIPAAALPRAATSS